METEASEAAIEPSADENALTADNTEPSEGATELSAGQNELAEGGEGKFVFG